MQLVQGRWVCWSACGGVWLGPTPQSQSHSKAFYFTTTIYSTHDTEATEELDHIAKEFAPHTKLNIHKFHTTDQQRRVYPTNPFTISSFTISARKHTSNHPISRRGVHGRPSGMMSGCTSFGPFSRNSHLAWQVADFFADRVCPSHLDHPPLQSDIQLVHMHVGKSFESMSKLMDTVSPKNRDAMWEMW